MCDGIALWFNLHSLMTNETEHSLICIGLLDILFLALVESFAYFSITFLIFRSFFGVQGIVLSVVKSVFSQFLTCYFALLMILFDEQIF